MLIQWLSTLYLLVLAGMSVYGLWGFITLGLYCRHRSPKEQPLDKLPDSQLPPVTVQLPIYNERLVVHRLIETVSQLDYPPHLLQIQVIDDSTDETTQIAAQLVAHYQAQDLNIQLLHRSDRTGYKAGALAAGLDQATGEFIVIFDADFQPPPDFLHQTIPYFLQNPQLGVIQTRWGHLNIDQSPLTAAQAIAMDAHFAIEQVGRYAHNYFPKFNGTAGLWRRSCILDIGGWEQDTVCEDLCLSTRATLAGWQFCYLNHVVAPAELPAQVSAFKSQQARWAKGSTQCLLKFGKPIWQSPRHTPMAKIYAFLSMSIYNVHFLLILLLLLLVPLVGLNYTFSPQLTWFGVAGVAQPILLFLSQRVLYAKWIKRLAYLPALLLIAVGLAPSISRAILQALFVRRHTFERTPKGDSLNPRQRYRLPWDWIVATELFLAAYAALGLWFSFANHNYGSLFTLLLCFLGFAYVAYLSLYEIR